MRLNCGDVAPSAIEVYPKVAEHLAYVTKFYVGVLRQRTVYHAVKSYDSAVIGQAPLKTRGTVL